MKRIYIETPNQFYDIFRNLRDSGVFFNVGNSSITVPSIQSKVLNVSFCQHWESPLSGWGYYTHGEIANHTLAYYFPGLKKVGWSGKATMRLLDITWPRFFKHPYKGEATYIDLVAAYSQIYSNLWLDTPFPRGRGQHLLRDVSDSLRMNKGARNAVIGLTRVTHGWAMKNGRHILLRTKNKYLSPGLWGTVQVILHDIALKAVEMGAIYVATDGYIFPSYDTREFEEFLDYHRLSYRMESGFAHVAGWGSYAVGSKVTKFYEKGVTTAPLRYLIGPNDFMEYYRQCYLYRDDPSWSAYK